MHRCYDVDTLNGSRDGAATVAVADCSGPDDEQTLHHLQVVFDAMVHLLKQHLLIVQVLANCGHQAFNFLIFEEQLIGCSFKLRGTLPDTFFEFERQLCTAVLKYLLLHYVARCPCKPVQFSIRQADGSQSCQGPESLSSLALAPALCLEASIAGRGSQLLLRQACCDVFGGKEHRKVASQHLVLGIAFDAFGAHIPAEDMSSRVENVNGVV